MGLLQLLINSILAIVLTAGLVFLALGVPGQPILILAIFIYIIFVLVLLSFINKLFSRKIYSQGKKALTNEPTLSSVSNKLEYLKKQKNDVYPGSFVMDRALTSISLLLLILPYFAFTIDEISDDLKVIFIIVGTILGFIGFIIAFSVGVAKRKALNADIEKYKKIQKTLLAQADEALKQRNQQISNPTPIAKKYCNYCGALLDENATSCPHCGGVIKK